MRYDKVVLVLLDGLRPDAIRPDVMPSLHALAARYWQAAHAVTISPSVTVAALTSLATGVSPARHRFTTPSIGALPGLRDLTPLPHQLRQHGRQFTIVTSDLAPTQQMLATTLLGLSGIGTLVTGGTTPTLVAERAVREVTRRGEGMTFVYLNDCDRIGHAHGWMSTPYLEAAGALDRAVARLSGLIGLGDTLLLFAADHGGGGIVPDDHDGDHPLNLRIPLILAGRRLRDRTLSQRPAHLLDIPTTVLAALGVPVPASYEGRVLSEAFVTEEKAVA